MDQQSISISKWAQNSGTGGFPMSSSSGHDGRGRKHFIRDRVAKVAGNIEAEACDSRDPVALMESLV